MSSEEILKARAWVDVDLGALLANYDALLERANPRAGAMPVVKADAYGLGVCPIVRALESREPWAYGVATLAEGVELRERGIDRRVVCFFPTPQELDLAAEASMTPAIGDLVALEHWRTIARAANRRLPFHLEIDTGIGRLGFHHAEVEDWLPKVLEACETDLEWEGTFTHYRSADEPDSTPTGEQWQRFQACVGAFPEGVGGVRHTAASAAAARWPQYSADLLRPGLFLYGALAGGEPIQPQPVVTVQARVTSVRDVPKGWTASYGATFEAPRPSRWATLSVGYGDGLRRELSNTGFVGFGDRVAPIIGRVCMDVTVVDVTELPDIEAGAAATLIGGPPTGPYGLSTVAERCGTITYEILTGLTRRLPRHYQPE